MSCNTSIGGASGGLEPGVIAVVNDEKHYCLFNGDLVERLRHDDNCCLLWFLSARDMVRRWRMEVMWALRITLPFPAHYIFFNVLELGD